MAKTPDQVANKWKQAMSAATQAITDGVNAVQVSPMQKAAARADAYAAGVQRSVAEGKYQAGLNKVSLADWKQAMTSKGIPRIAAGVTMAAPKVQQFMAQFLPHVYAARDALNSSMPRGDYATNIQRMVAMAEANHQFKRR